MRLHQTNLAASGARALRVVLTVCSFVAVMSHPLGIPSSKALEPDQIAVVDSHVSYTFADEMSFSVQGRADTSIARCYLFFRAATEDRTRSVDIAVLPANDIVVTHTINLQETPLPPFATISYWWEISDTLGNRLTTAPQEFRYTDNRFEWRELSEDNITVYWLEGDTRFGQAALDVAHASLDQIGAELEATPPDAVAIYVYDSQEHLSKAMVIAGHEWAAGQAHPELGTIVIAVPDRDGYSNQMANYIPHEISHLLIYSAMTPAGYAYVPEWLDEGIAVANEGLPTPEYAVALEQASDEGKLISLSELCRPFSSDAYRARLAYAESGSIVRFIRQEYGTNQIRALLQAYARGASCAAGVEVGLGLSISGLENQWQASLAPHRPWRTWLDRYGPYAGFVVLGLLLAIPMVGFGLKKGRG